MVLGIAVYVLYRRNQKLPLTETVKVVLPEPLGVEEVEYRSVLVGFEDDEAFSPEMVATAVKLASKRRRGIHVHSMLTVPTHLPLNAEMPEQEAEAQRKVEEAKLIGGQRVTGHVARVRPGQAGYSVAEEAELIKAAAIVVGLRYRGGVPLYDKTLQTVLGERPCRVIVVSDPTDKPGRRSRPKRWSRSRGDRRAGGSASTAARCGASRCLRRDRAGRAGRDPGQRRRAGLGRVPDGHRLPRRRRRPPLGRSRMGE